MPLRFGILGTARIARSFVEGVRLSRHATVTSVASRDAAKARAFAQEAGLARHFASYEALLADRDIDAVYIPLPNSLHAEWSIRALQAGKHVLCEKPLSATAAEARAMFDAARQHGVHLVEGYPYRTQPQTLKLRELLDGGVIGDVQLIQGSFGFTLGAGENIRLSPQLAGGALMDVGTYPVNLARMIAKARPIRVHAVAEWSASGVDRALAATLVYESGLFAQITCGFNTCVHRQALIAGTRGVIQTTYLNHTSVASQAVLQLRVGTDKDAVDSIVQSSAINGFLAEADSFARLVSEGPAEWLGTTPEESIDGMLTLEAILESARSGRTVEIPLLS
ncbi:MAG TPA: Gfo/Idh/MocA family oxidoreductase [Steroidobacteraceae bacterium]|jgi:xylose dehydrogenase (NAD/NADP)|nr:Gfo/Idh/MocA family oxidoreductase [Steroidobacteraceae bacterium]